MPVVHAPGLAISFWPTVAFPEIVGVDVASDAFATGTLATEVRDTGANPGMVPVTRTLTCDPASRGRSVYWASTAPAIALPSRSHWYAHSVPAVHSPGPALSVAPTMNCPVTDGTEDESFPAAIVNAELLLVSGSYPKRAPVISTAISAPRSSETSA